jgi:DNA-binding XRE family transcriptional regulator/predicted RNase H-like HicB family nuclease
MRYPAIITKEGKKTLASFADCPGCQTEADPGEDISVQAADALTGWLESHLLLGRVPPRPSKRKPKGKVLWVEVPPGLAVKLLIRWARNDAGLTQAQVAKRAKVSQRMIAKLENPNYNPTLETLEKVASALGARLEVNLAQDAA